MSTLRVPKIKSFMKLNMKRRKLLYPEGTVTLNHSGFEILSRCNGFNTVECIYKDLEEVYELVDRKNIDEFLACAHANHWITFLEIESRPEQ